MAEALSLLHAMDKYSTAFGALDRNGDAGIDLAEFRAAADDGTLLAMASRVGATSSAFVVATLNAVSEATLLQHEHSLV